MQEQEDVGMEPDRNKSAAFMRQAAREAIMATGNDETAAAMLEDRLLSVADDYNRGIVAMVAAACQHYVRMERHRMRVQLRAADASIDPLGGTPETRSASGAVQARRLRAQAVFNMYFWPMQTGGFLGDADKAQVDAEADAYARAAGQSTSRQRMFERISELLKGPKKVREQVAAEKLAEIRDMNGVKE